MLVSYCYSLYFLESFDSLKHDQDGNLSQETSQKFNFAFLLVIEQPQPLLDNDYILISAIRI